MTTVTTQTIETVTQTATTARTWKAREIQRLCQLPLESDDPAPARVEACITSLENRVRDLPGHEDVTVTEEEDVILREIQRYDGKGQGRGEQV